MYLKIQQKLHCVGCISKQTMRAVVKKTRLNFFEGQFLDRKLPLLHKKKAEHSFELSLSIFLSFNGVFLTLKCRTLVLKHLHGARAAAICLKWMSATKVSKCGKSEYSRALNASYTFQPLMSFWFYGINRTLNSASQPVKKRRTLFSFVDTLCRLCCSLISADSGGPVARGKAPSLCSFLDTEISKFRKDLLLLFLS